MSVIVAHCSEMKWLLAIAQLSVLVTIWRRDLFQVIPVFACYSALALLSSVLYNPWAPTLFAWASFASTVLACWLFAECLNLLVAGYPSLLSLVLAAAIIGGLVLFCAVCLIDREYSPGVMLTIYTSVIVAGGFWTMLGVLWLKCGVRGWKMRYSVTIGIYLGIIALSRISAWHWQVVNDLAMALRTCCYVALFRAFEKRHYCPDRSKKYQEHREFP